MPHEKRPNSATIVIVSLAWKGDTIATRAASSGEVVALGDLEGSMGRLPAEVLGAQALAIADADGGPHVRIPEGKVASILTEGKKSRLVAGPARIALAAEEEATVVFGPFAVVVAGHAEEAVGRRARVMGGAWAHTAMVAALHAGLLFAGSRAAWAGEVTGEDQPQVEQMRAYLAAAEERSAASDPVLVGTAGIRSEQHVNGQSGNGKAGGGERHEGEAGKAGATTSRANKGHWSATAKSAEGTSTAVVDDLESARTFGMAGLLGTMNTNAGSQPSAGVRAGQADSPWGASDPFATAGGMLGRSVGESAGAAGLSLTGVGEGGGGRGEGIGLGGIGTLGHIAGLAGIGTGGTGSSMSSQSFGWGIGRLGGMHRTKPPVVRWGGGCCGVWGRLPPEVVQRVIRANFGRFRACYQAGLAHNPDLEGRVTTSFVIGLDGAVSNMADGGSDLPDQAVKSCVVRAFGGLSFPQPEGGIVTVVYPITFSSPAASNPVKAPISFTAGE